MGFISKPQLLKSKTHTYWHWQQEQEQMSVPVYLYLAFLYSKTTHRVGIWTVSKDTAESRSMGHWDMEMADG